jgi:hypothetical protein
MLFTKVCGWSARERDETEYLQYLPTDLQDRSGFIKIFGFTARLARPAWKLLAILPRRKFFTLLCLRSTIFRMSTGLSELSRRN